MDDARLERIEIKLDSVDDKIDAIRVMMPRFVTWGKLGGAIVSVGGLAIMLYNVLS